MLLALGFSGPEPALAEAFGVALGPRGTIARSASYETDVAGVFVCGDAGRGQSLIVWAIAEGRSAAAAGRPLPGRRHLLPDPRRSRGAAGAAWARLRAAASWPGRPVGVAVRCPVGLAPCD